MNTSTSIPAGYLRIISGNITTKHLMKDSYTNKKWYEYENDYMQKQYINPNQITKINEKWTRDEHDNPMLESTTITLTSGDKIKAGKISADKIMNIVQEAMSSGTTIDLIA